MLQYGRLFTNLLQYMYLVPCANTRSVPDLQLLQKTYVADGQNTHMLWTIDWLILHGTNCTLAQPPGVSDKVIKSLDNDSRHRYTVPVLMWYLSMPMFINASDSLILGVYFQPILFRQK